MTLCNKIKDVVQLTMRLDPTLAQSSTTKPTHLIRTLPTLSRSAKTAFAERERCLFKWLIPLVCVRGLYYKCSAFFAQLPRWSSKGVSSSHKKATRMWATRRNCQLRAFLGLIQAGINAQLILLQAYVCSFTW